MSEITMNPTASSDPITIDTDPHAHVLGTYAALRLSIVVVTGAFLLTLAGYRHFGPEPSNKRESISAYYHHTNADLRVKDIFVGTLSMVALLLIAYQGYTDRENWALNIGGTALLCVVAFPMDWNVGADTPGERTLRGWGHIIIAIVFFFSLGYVGLYRSQDSIGLLPDGPQKTLFKNLYRITGAFMWAVPAITVTLVVIGFGGWVYAIEFFGVSVFLVYWLVKSREMKASLLETRAGMRLAETQAIGPKKR